MKERKTGRQVGRKGGEKELCLVSFTLPEFLNKIIANRIQQYRKNSLSL